MEAGSKDATFHAAGLPPTALSIITTEHFALQGARGATISESTGRAGMFLSAVSGGLVALGLIGTASRVGSAFYAFGLALLPTLALIGVMTFQRVLQSGVEDHDYARRIAQLRTFYFEQVPQLVEWMPRVPAQEQLSVRGLSHGRAQGFLTAAGMVAIVTAVLVGGAAGLLCSVLFDHSLAPALGAGAAVSAAALFGLTEYQRTVWIRADSARSAASEMSS
ncbi:MAG TPA: hypothetical protein VMB27_03450 [Solirubrobacteraceae bacterium]|nr:hypothetical protein [Solirubrobacteraceae bacterium]